MLHRRHMQIQQPRQRHVNIRHLAKRNLLVDAAQCRQLFFIQQQRSVGTESLPLLAAEGTYRLIGAGQAVCVWSNWPLSETDTAGPTAARP